MALRAKRDGVIETHNTANAKQKNSTRQLTDAKDKAIRTDLFYWLVILFSSHHFFSIL